MSYYGIKDQLTTRLGVLGYTESKEAFDFGDASNKEYGNTFILNPISGSMDGEFEGENLVNRFYDSQTWQIQIAFEKSAQNQTQQRDVMNDKIADILSDLDNPTNWQDVTNGAVTQRYQAWEITDQGNYFLLSINLNILDKISY